MDLPCGRPSAAQIWWTLAFAVSLIAGRWTLDHFALGFPERLFIALVPIGAGVGCMWAMVADMRQMDELQRRIWLEAIGVAFIGTLVFLFSEPVLRRAGFLVLTNDKVLGVMLILAMLGLGLSARRYQ